MILTGPQLSKLIARNKEKHQSSGGTLIGEEVYFLYLAGVGEVYEATLRVVDFVINDNKTMDVNFAVRTSQHTPFLYVLKSSGQTHLEKVNQDMLHHAALSVEKQLLSSAHPITPGKICFYRSIEADEIRKILSKQVS